MLLKWVVTIWSGTNKRWLVWNGRWNYSCWEQPLCQQRKQEGRKVIPLSRGKRRRSNTVPCGRKFLLEQVDARWNMFVMKLRKPWRKCLAGSSKSFCVLESERAVTQPSLISRMKNYCLDTDWPLSRHRRMWWIRPLPWAVKNKLVKLGHLIKTKQQPCQFSLEHFTPNIWTPNHPNVKKVIFVYAELRIWYSDHHLLGGLH